MMSTVKCANAVGKLPKSAHLSQRINQLLWSRMLATQTQPGTWDPTIKIENMNPCVKKMEYTDPTRDMGPHHQN